jgi:1-acyl-sn-glycerol-3-phosphate acyltransferase
MNFLCSALFNAFFFAATFLMTLVPATVVRFVAPHRILDVARLWARIMVGALRLICSIRVQVYGMEYLGGNEARLIASCHQSAFDTVIWLTLLPRCCYVLKRELLRVPLFGPLMPLAGMIAVDRVGGATALRGLVRDGERAAREGRQIVIFPEGTRAEPGAELPLQPGVAALAGRTRLPVIPVLTDSGLCWGRRAFHKRPGTIHIRILEPIPAEIGRDELMRRLEVVLRTPPTVTPQSGDNSVGCVPGRLVNHRNE